jgi:hypothetical protein
MPGRGEFLNRLQTGDVAGQGRLDMLNAKKVCVEKFIGPPIMAAALGSAATATSLSTMIMPGGNVFSTTPVVGQTLIAPVMAATGLDVAGDQTDNDGRGIIFAPDYSGRSCAFTVGQGAFYAKLRFSLADVSGTDLCMFGFRKAIAHNADATAYSDMATLNVRSGTINISTNLASAGISHTSTTQTWADTATHTLEVYVSNAGLVTYKIDGAAPTVTAAMTLTAGLVMVPFFQFLMDTDVCDTMILQYLEFGLQ